MGTKIAIEFFELILDAVSQRSVLNDQRLIGNDGEPVAFFREPEMKRLIVFYGTMSSICGSAYKIIQECFTPEPPPVLYFGLDRYFRQLGCFSSEGNFKIERQLGVAVFIDKGLVADTGNNELMLAFRQVLQD